MKIVSRTVFVITSIIAIVIVLGTVLAPRLFPHNIKGTKQNLVISKSVCDEVLKQREASSVTKFDGKPAKVDFSNYPEAKNYYTMITKQASEGPNFAGHYTYADWGCGTNCLGYAVVDSITGNIITYQGGDVTFEGPPSFDINSRLLVFNPKKEFDNYKGVTLENIIKEGYYYPILNRDYFELIEETGGVTRLDLLCTENVLDGIYSMENGPVSY